MNYTTCSACGFERVPIKEGKNGTLSIHCSECGTLAMVKSPKAVMALRKRIAVPPAVDRSIDGKADRGSGAWTDDLLKGL